MTCWTGSEKDRVSTQAGHRSFRRSSCDWTEPACVRPGGVETHAPHAGPTVVSERMGKRLAVAVALSPLPRTDDEHPSSYSAKACRQLYERGPHLSQVADPSSCALAPRLLRLRDAPRYLGMDKNRFNREVRPCVTVIPIGIQGVAFDRLDLDAWADEHKRRNGCPAAQSERTKPRETIERQVSPSAVGSGKSTKCSEELAFARALQRTISPKPRSNSPGG